MKNKDKIIGSVVIFLVFVMFLLFGFLYNSEGKYDESDIFIESTNNSTEVANKQVENTQSKIIKVQIKGEVKKPGVYALNYGERVEDLIKLAGGFTDEADVDRVVSQAKKLRDEECIVVPKKDESNNDALATINAVISNNSSISVSGKVNVNTATKEELMKVPGIGEVIAANIIEYRESNGDFNSLEDLKKVDRIGEKTLEKMKDKLEVN